MKTTTNYRTEGLFRLAQIILKKNNLSLNSFFAVGTSADVLTLQGWLDENSNVIRLTQNIDKLGTDNLTFMVGKYIRIVLSVKSF